MLSEEFVYMHLRGTRKEILIKISKKFKKGFYDEYETLFKIFLEFITSSSLPNIAFLHEQLGESQDFRAHYDIPLKNNKTNKEISA